MGNRQYLVRFDFIYEEDMKLVLSKLSSYSNDITTKYNPKNNMYSMFISLDTKDECDKIAKIIHDYFNDYFKSIAA